jgi:hypothetical protein
MDTLGLCKFIKVGDWKTCMPGHTSLEAAYVNFYSFWKPREIPPRTKRVDFLHLDPFGKAPVVASQILKIPNTYILANTPSYVGHLPLVRFLWDVQEGVVLMVRPECNINDDSVFCIEAFSVISDKVFYKLYVQMHEHFGAVLFDEIERSFITPEEFKNRKK